MNERLVIRFDGPPGPTAGRFVEVELGGKGVSYGEWEQDGEYWLLVLPDTDAKFSQLETELEWRRREMDRAMDAMHEGEYQWQEDDAKAMGQTVEGFVETLKAIVV